MTVMEITASVDFKNYKIGEAGGVEKHNKREFETDSNEFVLDGRNSDLNRTLQIDKNGALHERLKDEIAEKNQHALEMFEAKKYGKARYKKEFIEDEYDYMSRKKAGIASAIIQVGSTDDYKKFLDAENIPYEFDEKVGFTYPDKTKLEPVIALYNETYKALHDEFLASGAFVAYTYDLHMDEGYPHVHAQYINDGVTAGGKRSLSTNASVAKFLEYEGVDVDTNSKSNLRKLREVTDKFLVDEFDKNLKKYRFKTKDATLVRRGDTNTKASSQERKQAMQQSALEIESLKKQIEVLEKEKEDAKLERDRARLERDGLQTKVNDLTTSKTTLEGEISTLQRDKETLETEKAAAIKERKEARKKVDVYRKATYALKKALMAFDVDEDTAHDFAHGREDKLPDGSVRNAGTVLLGQVVRKTLEVPKMPAKYADFDVKEEYFAKSDALRNSVNAVERTRRAVSKPTQAKPKKKPSHDLER